MMLKGLNTKKLILTIVAVFATVFVIHFVVHAILLEQAYKATAHVWRAEADMQHHMPAMFLGQFLCAVFFSIIFAKGYEGKGIGEGVRFGLLIGGYDIYHSFIQYSVTQIPCSLLCWWVLAGLAQGVVAGVVASLVYRKA